MEQEVLELRVSTGKITAPIIDSDGEVIGNLTFNPNDIDILARYQHTLDELEAIKIPDKPDSDAILAISDKMKELIDYLLGFPVSADVFAKCNPLTLTESGDFYVEVVLEGIGALIEKTTKQRVARKKAKIRKAVAQYKS